MRKVGEYRNTVMCHQSQVPITFSSNRHFLVWVEILIPVNELTHSYGNIFLKKELESQGQKGNMEA